MIDWKEKDMFIYFLTLYSPELNMIEILWIELNIYGCLLTHTSVFRISKNVCYIC